MLTDFYNYVYCKGVPDSWNTLHILSLHKKGDKNCVDNYRGLSLMGVFAKLFALMINNKLTMHATANKLRANTQAGFRRNYRTDDNCVLLKSVIERAKCRGEKLMLLFIDLKKAYDSIDRSLLWSVLTEVLQLPEELSRSLKMLYTNLRAKIKEDW